LHQECDDSPVVVTKRTRTQSAVRVPACLPRPFLPVSAPIVARHWDPVPRKARSVATLLSAPVNPHLSKRQSTLQPLTLQGPPVSTGHENGQSDWIHFEQHLPVRQPWLCRRA